MSLLYIYMYFKIKGDWFFLFFNVYELLFEDGNNCEFLYVCLFSVYDLFYFWNNW